MTKIKLILTHLFSGKFYKKRLNIFIFEFLVPDLVKRANLPAGTALAIYEEIKPNMLEHGVVGIGARHGQRRLLPLRPAGGYTRHKRLQLLLWALRGLLRPLHPRWRALQWCRELR